MKKIYNHEETLRQRNELTKLKLQAEFGGKFSGESELNPVLENIFLKNVLEFEKAMSDSKPLTINELLGHPQVKANEEVSEEELSSSLEEVLGMLNDKNIYIDTICGVTDREMYRFITQEIFLQQTESNIPKGMMTCFIYEEFHPNHEHDINTIANDFINRLCDKDNEYFHSMVWPGKNGASRTEQEMLLKKINLFRDSFDSLTVENFEIKKTEVEEVIAIVDFEFRFSAFPAGSRRAHIIGGKGRYTFVYEADWWIIKRVEMHGVV